MIKSSNTATTTVAAVLLIVALALCCGGVNAGYLRFEDNDAQDFDVVYDSFNSNEDNDTTTTAAATTRHLQEECAAQQTIANEMGYIYEPSFDSKGNTLVQLQTRDIKALAKACNERQDCAAFNHMGELKKQSDALDNPDTWYQGLDDWICEGLYVKKLDEERCPHLQKLAHGYTLTLPGFYSNGNVIKTSNSRKVQDLIDECNKIMDCVAFRSE